jgi:hypothetical protein
MTVTPTYLTANASELVLTTPGFDDLLLLGTTVDDDGNAFHIEAQAAEATWDNPVPIDVSVQRWLTDGAVASTQGHDNRTPYFKVIVSAATSLELAAGERALAARAERIQRGEQIALLTWISAEGRTVAPASVFEVWTWHLEHEFDADRENRVARMYGVRCTAKPWVRSLDLTQVVAVTTSAGAPTVISIDACTSTTGWTGTPNAPTTSSGAVRETTTVSLAGSGLLTLKRTGTVTGLGAVRYLTVDFALTGASLNSIVVKVDGVALNRVRWLGTVTYWALAGRTSFTTLEVVAYFTINHGGTVALAVNDVSAVDVIGGVGSAKQLTRSLDVGGSVPTSGSLEIASPDATALGTVLAYTCVGSSGYSPPMRQYRTSGNTVTPDAAAVSGNHEALVTTGTPAGTITYQIPPNLIREATYAVVARVQTDTGGTPATFTVKSWVQSSSFFDQIVSTQTLVTSGVWQWVVIGALTLPTQALPPEATTSIKVTLSATGSGTIIVDELYVLDLTHGAVSLLDCGTATRVWIEAPDVDPVRNRPAIYLGTTDDRSDAIGARQDQILSMGEHDLAPEGSSLLTVTDGVGNASATASFYQRWHTQPAA